MVQERVANVSPQHYIRIDFPRVMPVVTKVIPNLDISNDPSAPVATGFIDLSMECSKLYSRNVRQGQTFTLKGVQAAIIPSAGLTDDWDNGMSVNVKHEYLHTTAHTRKIWNKTFNVWKQQQGNALSRTPVKYNDFEVGWHAASHLHDADRNSTIRSSGIGDGSDEKVVLWGDSTSLDDFTMQDYSNSMYDRADPSRDPFQNTVIKEPKFNHYSLWPEPSRFYAEATSSNIVTNLDGPNGYSGSITMNTMHMFPIPIKVMCGLMKYEVYIPLDDTILQYADTCDLILMYYVSSMKPLVYRPKARKKKAYSTRRRSTRGRKSSRRKR